LEDNSSDTEARYVRPRDNKTVTRLNRCQMADTLTHAKKTNKICLKHARAAKAKKNDLMPLRTWEWLNNPKMENEIQYFLQKIPEHGKNIANKGGKRKVGTSKTIP